MQAEIIEPSLTNSDWRLLLLISLERALATLLFDSAQTLGGCG